MAHWFISKKYIPSIIDLTPSRLDLTHLDVYSIDPFGCRDIDDALSFDNNIIGIHIADVSSYIEEGGLLDNELSNRVETFYDIQKTIHMIPEELSIHHMSLIEQSIKRAFSVLIYINNNQIVNVEFKKTLIIVKKNMKYEDDITCIQELYDIGKHLKETIKYAFPINEEYDTHQMVAVYMIIANKLVGEKIK